MEAGFDLRELEKLSRDLERVADRYPDKSKDFLKREGNQTRNLLRSNTKAKVKGHRKRTTKDEKKTALLRGIRRTGVQTYRDDYQIRVKNVAPHGHLFEHGHVQWAPVPGKGRKHQRKTEQYVPGRHPAAATANAMKQTMPGDAAEMIDELLREGLEL